MKHWPGYFLIFNLFVLFSCSHEVKQTTVTPRALQESLYKDGLLLLKNHKLVPAELKFHEAIGINENFAPAYEGLGLVSLQRREMVQAEKYIDRALALDRDWIPTRLARSRLHIADGAYEYALDELKLALHKIDHKKLPKIREEIHFYLGQVYFNLEEFEEAKLSFTRVLKYNPDNQLAREKLDHINDYLLLIQGKADFLKQIAAKKTVTRADLAVVLVSQLSLADLFHENDQQHKFKNSSADERGINGASDVAPDFYAKIYIDEALRSGIMELLPDATFRPADKINRAEMAMIVEQFLITALEKPELETKYFKAQRSPYEDVAPYLPIYNAVMLASEYRILGTKQDKKFGPRETISGFDLFKIVERMKAVL